MPYLQKLLSMAGLEHVSREIEQHALLSVRLRTHLIDEAQLHPGSTKFGGSPDAPQGWIWPEYHSSVLPFVAQINLSEMAPYTRASLLPSSGILYFFFDVDAFFEMWPRDQKTWAVYYDGSTHSALQHIPIPETSIREKVYRPSAATFTTEITLPNYNRYNEISLQRMGLLTPLTEEEEQGYYQVQRHLAQMTETKHHVPTHRFLGHADPVQWEMQSELPGTYADWQLLLQVDSDEVPHIDWGDTGRIYYWIRKQDLLQCNFSQVQLILQST